MAPCTQHPNVDVDPYPHLENAFVLSSLAAVYYFCVSPQKSPLAVLFYKQRNNTQAGESPTIFVPLSREIIQPCSILITLFLIMFNFIFSIIYLLL